MVKKVGDQVTKGITDELTCASATALAVLPNSLAADYDIKFYDETVAKVLAEIRPIKNLQPKDFWTSLSPDSRDSLNYELNIMLTKKNTTNAAAVYQSTAYFFTEVKDTFRDNTDYKLRDAYGSLFSFVIRAQKTTATIRMNFKCGRHERTDLSAIKIGPEVLLASEIKEIYECRTMTKSLMLMEVRDTLYLNAARTVYRLPGAGLKKNDNKRKLELKFVSRDVDFKIQIKKNRIQTLKEWQGRKSKIELITPDYAIDDEGACNTLKHALEV